MVKHGDLGRDQGHFLFLEGLLLVGEGLMFYPVLDAGYAGHDVLDLFVEEVLHVLGVGFDLDDDVAVVFVELGEGEAPIVLHQFLLVGVHGDEEHVGLVGDLVGSQEGLERLLEVVVLQIPALQHARV